MQEDKSAQRGLVIKVGTNVLTRPDGRLDITHISHLVDQLADLKRRGEAVILVTSGAVGAGRELMPQTDHLDPVVRRQLLSAVGQVRLMELYRQLFAGHGLLCAQILATKEDFRDRTHYLNMRSCFQALLHDQIVPVVNENDVVSVTELMFTDNDELAGLVAAMVDARALLILSSVDGLFDGTPGQPGARLIEAVDADDRSAQDYVNPGRSSFGRGGMQTKLRIAQQTARLGVEVLLTNGRRHQVLTDWLDGRFRGTRIASRQSVSSLKRWIAQQEHVKATVTINAGAAAALRDHSRVTSLLPVGILALEGSFEKGDTLRIVAEDGSPVGMGIAQYGHDTARLYTGQHGKRALIHYDYLYII